MNETLYSRTFNFHKVVRQQNSGAVADFILLYSAVYLRIQKWKNYWNRSTFAKVIVKIKVARFFMAHGVHSYLLLLLVLVLVLILLYVSGVSMLFAWDMGYSYICCVLFQIQIDLDWSGICQMRSIQSDEQECTDLIILQL